MTADYFQLRVKREILIRITYLFNFIIDNIYKCFKLQYWTVDTFKMNYVYIFVLY